MFWDNVENLRHEQKFTYREIARRLDMAETTVSSMRRFSTELRLSDALKIADMLCVDVRELAG